MLSTWTPRGRGPRGPFVPTVAGYGRKLKFAEPEGLTGREIAVRSGAAPSAMMESARHGDGPR